MQRSSVVGLQMQYNVGILKWLVQSIISANDVLNKYRVNDGNAQHIDEPTILVYN